MPLIDILDLREPLYLGTGGLYRLLVPPRTGL